MNNYCARCGKQYDGSLIHCPYCMRTNTPPPQQLLKKKKHNKGGIVIVIVLVLLGTFARIFLSLKADLIQDKISSFVEETLNINMTTLNSETEGESNNIETCVSLPELVAYVEKNLLAKKETMIVRLGGGLTTNDILNINQYVNPCWGSCTQYRERVALISNNTIELELSLEFTDEVYVYDAICNGGDINQAPKTAQKLHKRVKRILDNEIKPSMSDYKKELAFYKYLLDTCIYNKKHVSNCTCSKKQGNIETPTDSSHTAYGALVEGNPVCSGYARAMHLLLSCEGIPAKIISGKGEGEEHCWNLVELEGEWYQLDATWDDNDIAKKSLYYYFNITEDMMYGSHIWDKEMYPEATGKKYNYYRLKKKYFTKKNKFKKSMYQTLIKSKKKTYTALLDGFRVKDKDMEILFDGEHSLSSVRWNMIEDSGDYIVIKIMAG